MDAAWYWRTSRRTLTHVRLAGDTGQALDLDHYFLLGGDNGLRGYPLRYQQGSGRALFNIEERLYSRTGRCGGCSTSAAPCSSMPDGLSVATRSDTPQLGWLRDVGRRPAPGQQPLLARQRPSFDVAAPLDGQDIKRLQLLVGAVATF